MDGESDDDLSLPIHSVSCSASIELKKQYRRSRSIENLPSLTFHEKPRSGIPFHLYLSFVVVVVVVVVWMLLGLPKFHKLGGIYFLISAQEKVKFSIESLLPQCHLQDQSQLEEPRISIDLLQQYLLEML